MVGAPAAESVAGQIPALRVDGLPPEAKVRVPTVTRTPKKRIALERAFEAASLNRADLQQRAGKYPRPALTLTSIPRSG